MALKLPKNLNGLEIIKQIHDLITFLSQPKLSVAEVIAHIGRVEDDPGAPLPVRLKPKMKGLREAKLFLDSDTGLPYLLKIYLSPETTLTTGLLRKEFPHFSKVISPPESNSKIVYYPPGQNPECKIALIAELGPAADGIDSAGILSISFRRDLDIPDPL